jgi:hypothetical protein
MPKVSPIQGNFNGGEISPLVYGRTDIDRYRSSLAKCKNYVPTIQGGLPRRPGSRYVAPTKTYNQPARLQAFEFSTTQAYMLEFGGTYVRFYKDNAPITETAVSITGITKAEPAVVTAAAHGFSNGDDVEISGVVGMTQVNGRRFRVAGVTANTFELNDLHGGQIDSTAFTTYSSGGSVARVYTVTTPYSASGNTLQQLKFTQSADVLYITHPSYAPRKLTRTGHTSWTLSIIDFLDGPYLPENTTATTLGLSATSGSVTVTASATTGINGGLGFLSTDVGRLIRWMDPASDWTWLKITNFTDSTHVTATIVGQNASAGTATTVWRLGLYSATTGYPACSVFHEDRLFFAGCPAAPQRGDGSNTGDYENFSPSDADGTIVASHALGFTLNSNDVNVVRWMTSDEKGLLAGSLAKEWSIKPSSQGEALTPTNITAKQATNWGSADIQPVQSGKATLFVQRAARKLRELTYFYDVEGFRALDMTVLAEHITLGNDGTVGLVQLGYQKEPQPIIWGVRSDGILVGATYERELETIKAAWHWHELGGVSNAAGDPPKVESVAVLPSADGTTQDVWLIVKRYINGQEERYTEYLTPIFDDSMDAEDAIQVDCSLTYDSPLTIGSFIAGSPLQMDITGHGLSNNDQIIFKDVSGDDDELNGKTFLVTVVGANRISIKDLDGNAFDGSALLSLSGGYVRKRVTQISGLWHLEGQTVSIHSDGFNQEDKTVVNGAITLPISATIIHIGYKFNSDGQLLRLDAGAADGTAIGKTRRIHRAGIMVHRSQGLKVGVDFDNLDEWQQRRMSDPMGAAPELFTGILEDTLEADYDFENQLCWRHDSTYPGTILAVMPQLVTQDR